MNKYILIVFIGLAAISCRRKGCTSYEAVNFDWKAKIDDGSCLFWAGWDSDFTPPNGADTTSPDPDHPGRYRLMTAESADGVTIAKTGFVLSDQACEPDVISHNDSLFVYYRSWEAGTETDRICVAISRDSEDWIYKHVSLTGYGSGELEGMRHPDVYKNHDDEFVMNLTVMIDGSWSIIEFISEKGLNFSFSRVLIQEAGVDHMDSHTFYAHGDFHLFTKDEVDSVHRHFFSENGTDFTDHGTNTFINGGKGCYVSSSYSDGWFTEIYAYHLPSQHIYTFSSSDADLWSQVFGTTVDFTGGLESAYLKDFCRERKENYEYFFVYSTQIP